MIKYNYEVFMEVISYTSARNKFAKIMDKVCIDHSPILVTRQESNPVVIISLEDYNAIEETLYLLNSPLNAQKLQEAIQDFHEKRNFIEVNIE
jgi:antitoxin YefM